MSLLNVANLPDNHCINTARRLEFKNKSFFYRHTHPIEKMIVDYELYTEVLSYLDQRFHIHDLEHTARIWDFVLKAHKIKWKKEDDLTGAQFKLIVQAFQNSVITGSGVPTFDGSDDDIGALYNFLFMKNKQLPSSFFRWENLKKLLCEPDTTKTEEFRSALEKALQTGFESFNCGKISEEIFKAFVFNVLALLPFTYPLEGATINIPTKINNMWQMSTYRIDKKFLLTPTWFSSPLPAYGLVAETMHAPPIIACLGTTYPAGEGFVATLLSDFTPGFSVGEAACLYAEKEIGEWLKGKTGVHVVGASLGGAISLHLSRHHSHSISDVYAYNPPGLYPWNWKGVDNNHIIYHIYSNENDLVSTMGILPEGENVQLYRMLSDKKENFVCAHNKTFPAAHKVTLVRTSAQVANSCIERKVLTVLHVSFSFVIFCIVLPIHFIYRLTQLIYQLFLKIFYPTPEKDENSINQVL